MKIEINIDSRWIEVTGHDNITDGFGTPMSKYMEIYNLESLTGRDWYINNDFDVPYIGIRFTI